MNEVQCDMWRDENNLYIKIPRQHDSTIIELRLVDEDNRAVLIHGSVNGIIDGLVSWIYTSEHK